MIKKGDELPPSDTVLRYIRPRYIVNGIINGAAFLRRPQETASSVNWLEYYSTLQKNEQVEAIRQTSPLNFHKNGRLALLNIKQTKNFIAANSNNPPLSFIYDPTSVPSHSLIYHIPEQDSPEAELIEDLLALCIKENFPTFV